MGTEGALAPLAQAVTGRAATALDRRLQDVERIMQAEAPRLASSAPLRQTGSERRLVPVGAVERRYQAGALVVDHGGGR